MRLRALGLMMLGAALFAPASAGAAGPDARHARVPPAGQPEHRRRLRPPDRAAARQPRVHAGDDRGAQRGLGAAARPAGGHPRTGSRSRRATSSPAGTAATRCAEAGPARRGLRVPVSIHEPLRRADQGQRVRSSPWGTRSVQRLGGCWRPYPGVVITTGSVQGSERMYWWLAQDLAERGYVVLTYDVQGQGTSWRSSRTRTSR